MFCVFQCGTARAPQQALIRLLQIGTLLGCACVLPAATLQQLSMDDLSAKSTAIIRGTVLSSYGVQHSSMIYTHYRVQVQERWKGPAGGITVEVALPGGTANAYRQTFAGIPLLEAGKQYVMFLWTGKNGLTQLIGPQGLFEVSGDKSGELSASRAVSVELMLDAQGKRVQDQPVKMTLRELNQHVSRAIVRTFR